jgi:hypothetical protein
VEAGKVVKVRVFVDRAAITRSLTLERPVREISFGVVPLDADTATLRAQAELVEGDARSAAKVTGVVWTVIYAERANEKQRAIAAEIEKTATRLTVLEDEEANESHALNLLSHYAEIAGDTIRREWLDREVSFDRWNTTFDHLRSRHAALAAKRAERQLEKSALQKKQKELVEEQFRLGRPEKLGYRVTVSLDIAERSGSLATLNVELTYVTPRARWTPVYDVRHVPPTANLAEHVKLTAVALVEQNTGEDWNEIELIATTARPPLTEPPPQLAPLMITGSQAMEQREIISVVRDDARLEGSTGADAETGPASVEHRAPGKVSIPATDRPVRVELFSSEVKSRARLEVAPRERPVAMLVADLENRTGRVLLPGRVNVFRGANYSGQTKLAHVAANERIRLPLGTDASVRVTRELKSHPEKKTTIIGSMTHTFESRTILENLGQQTLEIVLRDRVPVSRSEDATVKIIEMDRSMEVAPETGLATLTLSIPPHTKREVMLAYKVTAPRGFRLRPPPVV